MAVADVFKVYLYADPLVALTDYNLDLAEDITSGILNVDIQFGTDIYEGPQQQIDTGQFTIVTRNPAMDPKINANLKYNSAIKFYDERSGEFFRGYVTDIQVEYQRKDDPIITITGTDIFGAMQRVVVDQDTHDAIMALSTGLTWNGLTFNEFMPYMTDFTSKYLDLDALVPSGFPAPYGFWFSSTNSYAELDVGFLGYSPAKYIPQVGESYLEVINKYAQTNMTSFSARSDIGFGAVNVSSFPKWDPNYWAPQQDPMLEYQTYDFSSDPIDARPYQSILLNNGYNRVINQTDISNEYRYVDTGELKSVSESFTRISSTSIEDYAISRASMSTAYPEDAVRDITDWIDGYSRDIFQVTQYPGQEIQQITFDNARVEDIENDFSYSDYNLNKIVRIKHEVSDTETIDRVYDIAGISHNISPNNWEMTFTLKPSAQEIVFNYQGSLPTLEMNATSGDSNFNFTATLIDYDPATVETVVWALSATDSNEIAQMWPYVYFGNMFKNGVPRTGLTQTWNFDDDGILAPYSFDPDSTFQDPLDNRFGGYGTGYWNVYAYVILTNGFIAVLQQQLTVGTPAVQADFGWTQNLTNNFGQVTFINTSVNNETGEVNSYAWDFGDGTTSALENPVHVYVPAPDETEYEVSLTVFAYGPGGVEVPSTHTETVTLVQPAMTADFTWAESPRGTAIFTNTSTNVGFEEPDAYSWDFGDGTYSTQKNPTKEYAGEADASLSFTVTLITRNIWEQTSTVTKTVTISPLYDTGTLRVTQVRLARADGKYPRTPMMSYLKCLRSDGTNLSYNLNTTRTNEPGQLWWQGNGTVAPLSGTNLTRDPALSAGQFGLQFREGTPYPFSLNTSVNSKNIKNIKLTFDDIYPAATWASGWDRFYINVNDSFGGFYPIGYYDLPPIPNYAPRVNFGREYTMTAIRPMPPTIPYFKYTFNNTTVSFTSVETADSYAWTFGDGTTSTVKDPVKTYASKGTYNVTLAVTNGGVVTRTTTEPVTVEALAAYPVRYIKFAQKEHTGTHAFDTPVVNYLNPIFAKNTLVQTNPQASFFLQATSIAKAETYSMQYFNYAGNIQIDPISPVSSQNRVPYESYVRAKSLDGTFRTKWELIGDLGTTPINEISGFVVSLNRSTAIGYPATNATGISYEVFITDYVGAPAGISGATWTKIGEFNPTGIPTGDDKQYTMTPL